eukprot:m.183992 g.183992  ORF g.183992 m.183992 type:complete len:1141 (-) comp32175_c0_seq1:234-3656(-)
MNSSNRRNERDLVERAQAESRNRHDQSLRNFSDSRSRARQELDDQVKGAISRPSRSYAHSGVDRSALEVSRGLFDERQGLRRDEMRNSQLRMSTAEGHVQASTIPDHIGSAKGTIHEFYELEAILEGRLKTIEATARAVASASNTIDSEAMLARARAEAEAWTRGSASTNRIASQMDANQVQAIVAERNELRVQVRQASAELHKVKVATGADGVSMLKYCQQDKERVAALRSAVELETEALKIKLLGTREENDDLRRRVKAEELRTLTSEEQLAERAQTIVDLQSEAATLKQTLESNAEQAEVTLRDEIQKHRMAMAHQHQHEMMEKLKEQHDQHQADTRTALEFQRAEIVREGEQRLEEELSEQRHILQSQAQQQLAMSLEGLQRDLNAREAANLENLRNSLLSEHERATAALTQRIRTIESRGASDLATAKEQAAMELEKALEELKNQLTSDANYDKKSALEKLETTLTTKASYELQDLRENLTKRHQEEKAFAVKQAQDQLRKRLIHDHSQDKAKALKEQAHQLNDDKRVELQRLMDSLQKRHSAELQRELDKEADLLTKQLGRDSSRDRARALEKAQAELKSDKVKAVDLMRKRLEKQHKMDLDALTADVKRLTDEVATLKRGKTSSAEKLQSAFRKEKTTALEGQRTRLINQHTKEMDVLRTQHTTLQEDHDRLKKETAANLNRIQSEFRAEKTQATESVRARKETQMAAGTSGLKKEVARLSDELTQVKQEKVLSTEKLIADFRVEKTKEIEGLRQRMEEHHKKDVADMKAQIVILTGEKERLNTETHLAASTTQQQQAHGKQALHSLRDMLRKLLNSMKIALVPRVNAPLDTSVASPSQAMGALQVLIKGLSLRIPDVSALSDPTREAKVAPMVSFDILYVCAGELCEYLNGANEELIALHEALGRDRKIIRKQVEDELQTEFEQRLLEHRQQMDRTVEGSVHHRVKSMQQTHALQLEKERAQIRDELHTYKVQLQTQKLKFEQRVQDSAITQVAALDIEGKVAEEQQVAVVERMIHEADGLRRELEDKEATIRALAADKQALLDENQHLRETPLSPEPYGRNAHLSRSDSSFTASPAISPKRSLAMDGYDPRIFELERMRLEKRIANLQQALDHVLNQNDDNDDDDDYMKSP